MSQAFYLSIFFNSALFIFLVLIFWEKNRIAKKERKLEYHNLVNYLNEVWKDLILDLLQGKTIRIQRNFYHLDKNYQLLRDSRESSLNELVNDFEDEHKVQNVIKCRYNFEKELERIKTP